MAETFTHADQTQLVTQVYDLTLEIETAAQLSDWQRAARLARERSPMLHAISATQAPQSLALIRRIQTLDAVRLAKARVTQEELAAEYRTAIAAVGAARQYQQVGRLF
jgi:flagellar protein FliT